MDKLKGFLEELTIISAKYGIYIDGCGCCGSPYLVGETESDNRKEKELYFIDGKYAVDLEAMPLRWR